MRLVPPLPSGGVRCEHEAIDGGHDLQLHRPAEVTRRLVHSAQGLAG